MKQIYNFEQAAPPVLTEAILRERLTRRKQTIVLSVAGAMMQLCLVALAALLFPTMPGISLLCMAYVVMSLTSCGVLAVVFTKRRRFLAQ